MKKDELTERMDTLLKHLEGGAKNSHPPIPKTTEEVCRRLQKKLAPFEAVAAKDLYSKEATQALVDGWGYNRALGIVALDAHGNWASWEKEAQRANDDRALKALREVRAEIEGRK